MGFGHLHAHFYGGKQRTIIPKVHADSTGILRAGDWHHMQITDFARDRICCLFGGWLAYYYLLLFVGLESGT
jgi:hypothetical protein